VSDQFTTVSKPSLAVRIDQEKSHALPWKTTDVRQGADGCTVGWLEDHRKVPGQVCAAEEAGARLALADAVGDGSGQCPGTGSQAGVVG
jgi:hypothetical protein